MKKQYMLIILCVCLSVNFCALFASEYNKKECFYQKDKTKKIELFTNQVGSNLSNLSIESTLFSDMTALEDLNFIPNEYGVVFVNKGVSISGNGSNWESAAKELADVLYYINKYGNNGILEIWVAEGTYYPIYKIAELDENSIPTTDRDKSFILPKNVKIYGGFKGGETNILQRDWNANSTILSGDFNKDDDWSDWVNFNVSNSENNSYHIIISVGDVGETCLDGFTIMHGIASNQNSPNNFNSIIVSGQQITKEDGSAIYCKASSPIFSNLLITQNITFSEQRTAKGIIYLENTSALLINSIVKNNLSMTGGGAYCINDMSSMANVLIAKNLAIDGGGIYTENSYHEFINITIADNKAVNNGGGVYFSSNSLYMVSNSIFANNQADVDGQDIFHNNVSTYAAQNCLITDPNIIEEVFSGINIIIGQNPYFNFDYTLMPNSPAIDAGDNINYSTSLFGDKDLYGKRRLMGNQIDMGASEFGMCIIPDENGVVYVDRNVLNSGDGSSWENAVKEFADVLRFIKDCSNAVKEIWVVEGTYNPLYKIAGFDSNYNPTTDQDKAFLLPSDIKIYGGFRGGETSLNRRNWFLNQTILSGDIGDIDVLEDNSYHIVVAVGNLGSTVLDGFTIQGGYATGIQNIIVDGERLPQNEGGGILNINSPVNYNNLIVMQNHAEIYGGGICVRKNSPTFNKVTIQENVSYGSGGGVYVNASTAKFVNTLMIYNIAYVRGGGIQTDGAYGTILNTTIADNFALHTYSSGVSHISGSAYKIINTIIWNDSLEINGGAPTFLYSLVQHEDLSLYEGCYNGKILENQPIFEFNYSLNEYSPYINKGSNLYYDINILGNKDIANGLRISESSIDLGAFEQQSSTLPVELLSFSANCDANSIKLSWSTSSEINNDYFIIEKSEDLKSFREISKVRGAGNSNSLKSYYIYDNKLNSKISYYRLRQVDYDGTEKLYNIISADCEQEDNIEIEVFPNPVQSNLNLVIKNCNSDELIVEVINNIGQIVIYKNLSIIDSIYQEEINVDELKDGIYYLRILYNGNQYTKTFVKE